MEQSSEHIKNEAESLRNKIRRWQHEYYVLGTPTVSDAEFDKHFNRLLEIEKEHPSLSVEDSPTMRVGSDLTSDLPESEHSIPVLSLDKAYSLDEIHSWLEKTKKNAQEELSFCVEEKIDGVSIVLYYENGILKRGVTRGNGFVGNDITANIKTIGAVPLSLSMPLTIAVRGEVFLPLDRFDEFNKKMDLLYANPRNLTAGTLRRKKSSEVARVALDMFCYEGFFGASEANPPASQKEMMELLISLGFKVNEHTRFFDSASLSILEEYIEERTRGRQTLNYEIDGLVLKVNELDIRDALGYTGHHPRWAIAYKFESPEGETRVLNIEVQVGRTGRITPVARVEPVLVGGSTISNVTLHNQEYINSLELSIGDKVSVSKRGDVIPAVERVVEKNEDASPLWKIPGECPSCGTALVQNGAHHFCLNRRCPDQVRGRISFFVGKDQMDIDNCGPETALFLIEKGYVTTPADLYTFDPQKLEGEPGFGEKKIALLRRGIDESRKQPYKRVLPSLGIPDLGPKMTELLIDAGYETIDALLEAADRNAVDELSAIHGIGEKSAANVLEELSRPETRALIEELKEAGLNFKAEKKHEDVPRIFEGQSWCVTGSFEHFNPRSAAMEEVKKRGGKTVSGVSGKTTHLLAGEGAGSKLDKAKALGIVIVSEAEFLRMLE